MQELDKYQKEAVLATGNVLLIAGAGAGKTFTITKKIDYLIASKICEAEEILIISFTNKSVNDLRLKIKHNCDIKTFHKLAIDILKDHHVSYNLASDDYLEFIANEFFKSLSDNEMTQEILKFFHESDYSLFLKSYKYQEFIKVVINIIKIYKTNACNIDDFKNIYYKNKFISKYVYLINCMYNTELKSSGSMDFDDLIIEATNTLKNNYNYKYKYIIVDEFQDTSMIRFNLVNKLRIINHATLFCVGDDYQSIYHFSGCDLNIFLNFTKLVDNAKILKLKYTYRNSQELIDICSKFVMKNKSQIKKDLISNKHIDNPIEIIYYLNPKKAFVKLVKKLNEREYLVLGRNNKDITYFTDNLNVPYLSVHSSKGLEEDNVIIINLVNKTYGFPNKLQNNKLIEELHPSDKSILYAEERRLFYVALTRTKNKVYLLVPIFNKSIFIKEIKHNAKKRIII